MGRLNILAVEIAKCTRMEGSVLVAALLTVSSSLFERIVFRIVLDAEKVVILYILPVQPCRILGRLLVGATKRMRKEGNERETAEADLSANALARALSWKAAVLL